MFGAMPQYFFKYIYHLNSCDLDLASTTENSSTVPKNLAPKRTSSLFDIIFQRGL
jgi:hypothetical protein